MTAPSRYTYAAGPTAEVEVLVDAPPAVVWELVADIKLPARFSQEGGFLAWDVGARPNRRPGGDTR